MTVDVQTPDGLKSGSSVYEVTSYKAVRLTSEEKPGGGGLRGEAVVVDLPGGPLFVLLKADKAGNSLGANATLALLPQTRRGDIDGYVGAVKKLGAWFADYRAELPRDTWPTMVRFRDIGDPVSVEKVDPEAIGIERIIVETTDDPVTIGIENRLRWLPRLHGNYLNGASTARNALFELAAGDFSTEIRH